jgi:putative addiction module component (TIGR02574 family)
MSQIIDELKIEELSVEERHELIGRLWDSLTESPVTSAVPDWHVAQLQARCAAADSDPDGGIPWEVVRARLLVDE